MASVAESTVPKIHSLGTTRAESKAVHWAHLFLLIRGAPQGPQPAPNLHGGAAAAAAVAAEVFSGDELTDSEEV